MAHVPVSYVSEVRGVVSDAWDSFAHTVEEIHDSGPFQRYLEYDRKIVSMEKSAWNSVFKPVDAKRFASSYPSSDQVIVLSAMATVPPVVESIRADLGRLRWTVGSRLPNNRHPSRVRLEALLRQAENSLRAGQYKTASQRLDALRNSFSARSRLFSDVQPQLDSLTEKARALNQLSTAAPRAARVAPKVAEVARAAAPIVHRAGLAGGRIASGAVRAAQPAINQTNAPPPQARPLLLIGAGILALGGIAAAMWAMTQD